MNSPLIVVVGSYATGLTMRVKQFPRAGETVLGTGYRTDYGGKGSNQAVGCARLGAAVHFVAKIGNDSFGEMARRLYQEVGISIESLIATDRAPTGVGFILVEESSGNNCIALDAGANEWLSAEEVEKCAALDQACVVMSQLEIPVEAAGAAMAKAKKNGAATILNPAPARALPDSVLRCVDILTPNETEACVLTGLEASASPEELAAHLIERGVKNVVITQGEKGALLVARGLNRHFPAIRVNAVDTTGAGDAFNAGLATALTFGASLENAVQFGTITGGLAVTQHGVVPALPSRNDVVNYCRDNGLDAPDWMRS